MSIERRFSSERYDGSGVEDFSRSLTRWIDWIGRISGKDGGWRDMVGFSSFLEISERDSRLVSSLIWLILKRLSKYSFVFIKGFLRRMCGICQLQSSLYLLFDFTFSQSKCQ